MTAVLPISEVLIDVNRVALDAVAPIKASIDRGCSLTKFVYIPKDSDLTTEYYKLHCVLFRNEDFEAALYFLKEKALLPTEGKLRVTGTGCDMYKEIIEEVLGLEIEFIEEFVCNFRGLHFLLTHALSPDDLFYPQIQSGKEINVERPPELQEMLKKMNNELSANNGPDPEALFPCIFVLLGSAAVCHLVGTEGTGKYLTMSLIGGRSFLGMGKALVGTNDYDELMTLAEAGDVTNVDTTIGEFLKEDPDSPYGRFPPELPLFSFGKLIDSERSLEDFERADRASALVRTFAQNMYSLAYSCARQTRVSRIVIGGNGVRGEAMRRFIQQQDRMMGGFRILKFSFLKTGHTGAIGAMVSTTADEKFVEK